MRSVSRLELFACISLCFVFKKSAGSSFSECRRTRHSVHLLLEKSNFSGPVRHPSTPTRQSSFSSFKLFFENSRQLLNKFGDRKNARFNSSDLSIVARCGMLRSRQALQ